MIRKLLMAGCLLLLFFKSEGQASFNLKKLKFEFNSTLSVSPSMGAFRFSGAAGYWFNNRQALYLASGIDFYPAWSVPLYVEYRHKITQRPGYFFLFAGGGINFTTPSSFNREDAISPDDVEPVEFHNGWYAHYGIGKYFIKKPKKKVYRPQNDVIIMLGNSMKTYGNSVLQRVPMGSVFVNEKKTAQFISGRIDYSIIVPLFE
jgi:hypothetical protein